MRTVCIILAGAILALTACQRPPEVIPPDPDPTPALCASYVEHTTPAHDSMYNLPSCMTALGCRYHLPRYWYERPVPSPDDPNQILYYVKDRESDIQTGLWIIDLCTGTRTHIFADDVWHGTEWCSNGWILFGRPGQEIWKIKENGDSLAQVTFSGRNIYPRQVPGEAAFIVLHTRPSGQGDVFKYNFQGVALDSFPAPAGGVSPIMSPDGQYIAYYNAYKRIIYYEIAADTFHLLDISDVTDTFGALDWMPDSKHLVWTDATHGLFITSIETGQSQIIKATGYNNLIYLIPRIRADGQALVVGRVEQETIGLDQVRQTQSLVMMRLDGTDERHISLPE
ncbi:MAG: hypothetical protein SF053_09960 [Bacteroidia bacterium]|nr:hypothetical protein [Bacteroidia bacterium]